MGSQIKNHLNESLLQAAVDGSAETVLSLLERGADIHTKDKDGNTPLHLICSKRDKKVVENLLIINKLISSGADVNYKNDFGSTPLHYACISGEKDLVIALISNGANINEKNSMGQSPIHLSSYSKNPEAALLLISNGADVNDKDNAGNTPLHEACFCGNKEIVLAFILNGIDIDAKNNKGNTAINWTVSKETAMLLIAYGADASQVKKVFSNSSNLTSLTMSQAAAQGGFTGRLLEILSSNPSSLPQDAPKALCTIAKRYKNHETLAAIKSFIASEAVDRVIASSIPSLASP